MMEPSERLLLPFPVYGMAVLADGALAVVGGGGRMRSGVSNGCEVHEFDEDSISFSKISSLPLADAATALTTYQNLLVTIIGTGCKNFLYKSGHLAEESDFEHDIQVSSTEEQSTLALSVDGMRLVVASDSGPVRVLRYPECELVVTSRVHSQGVNDLDISPDSRAIGSSARDNSCFIWKLDDGETVQLLHPVFKEKLRSSIKALRFSPTDLDLLFAVECNPRNGGTWLSSWRRTEGTKAPWRLQTYVQALQESVSTLSVSPNGKLLAVASVEGHVSLLSWNGSSFCKLWNSESRESLFSAPRPSHALPVTSLCFSKSNRFLFSASADWTVAAWSVQKPIDHLWIFRWLMRILWLFLSTCLIASTVAKLSFQGHELLQRINFMPEKRTAAKTSQDDRVFKQSYIPRSLLDVPIPSEPIDIEAATRTEPESGLYEKLSGLALSETAGDEVNATEDPEVSDSKSMEGEEKIEEEIGSSQPEQVKDDELENVPESDGGGGGGGVDDNGEQKLGIPNIEFEEDTFDECNEPIATKLLSMTTKSSKSSSQSGRTSQSHTPTRQKKEDPNNEEKYSAAATLFDNMKSAQCMEIGADRINSKEDEGTEVSEDRPMHCTTNSNEADIRKEKSSMNSEYGEDENSTFVLNPEGQLSERDDGHNNEGNTLHEMTRKEWKKHVKAEARERRENKVPKHVKKRKELLAKRRRSKK